MHTQPEKKQKFLFNIYIFLIAIAGIAIIWQCVPRYVTETLILGGVNEITQFLVLLLIVSICRSLPLPTTRKDEEFNITTIVIYTALLTKGLGPTVLIAIISSFFTFSRWDGKKISHIFNTTPSKTIFNCFGIIIPMYLGWLSFQLIYGGKGPTSFEDLVNVKILLPSVVYILVFLIANSVMMTILFHILHGMPIFSGLRYGFFSMLPTFMMLAPLGYLLAYFYYKQAYMALVFFIPLLFARYAFKLYLDSRVQYMKTISTLTTAIEAKDEYTEGHSRRVGEYSVEIATFMGIKGARIENIKVAAVLHDIGKIGIEDEILRKPGKLTPEEWNRIRQHPTIGVHILEEVEMPQTVRDMIEYHHLHYDHSGYPPKHGDREIPMEVHIITLADAYDAMTSDRPYRRALPEEIAIQNIMDGRGTQFHPDVVDAFIKMKADAKKH